MTGRAVKGYSDDYASTPRDKHLGETPLETVFASCSSLPSEQQHGPTRMPCSSQSNHRSSRKEITLPLTVSLKPNPSTPS